MEHRLTHLTRAQELQANAAKRAAARGGTPVVAPVTQPTETILGQPVQTLPNRVQTGTDQFGKPIIKSGYEAQADYQQGRSDVNQFTPPTAAPQQPPSAPTTAVTPRGQELQANAAARGAARLTGTYAKQKEEIDNMKGYKDVPIIDPDTGETTGYTQEYSAEKTQEMQQSALDRFQAQIESDRKQKETERKGSQTATDPTLEGLPEDIQGAYQPGIDAANRAMDRAGEEIDTVYDDMTAEAIDAVTQKKQDEATELQIYQDHLNFNKQNDDLARDRRDESQRRLLAENETAQEMVNLEAKRAERLQRDRNVQDELQNRRLAAKLGINHDTGGLQWMQEEVRKGNETVSYLIQQNALSNKQLSQQRIGIINAYDLDMRQIDLDAKAAYDQAYSAYSSEKSAIKKDYLAGVKDRRTAIREAQQRYYDTLTTQDGVKAKAYQDANLKLSDQNFEIEKMKMDQEQMGWSLLNSAYNNYKSNIPQGILDRVSELTGVSVPELRARAAGGGGGIGGMYSQGGESNSPSPYPQITTADLSAAIKRVFSPANYGGTASERTKKTAEYLGRVSGGEDTGSILRDLSADYWSSQKGAPRTAHDGRMQAQSDAEILQSYVDHYAISEEDDGPLGRLDSGVQAFASVFGNSTQEYNDLNNYVGAIRARIIKENYGAAVTPQELALAISYVPDMKDKAGQFITKIQNLKAYNEYLDAKILSVNTGLPLPTPPTPITLNGTGVSGTSKYSTDDIANSLLD